MPKHKIFKYSKLWYFTCGWCRESTHLPSWQGAIYIGQDHVEVVHKDLLTAPLQL